MINCININIICYQYFGCFMVRNISNQKLQCV